MVQANFNYTNKREIDQTQYSIFPVDIDESLSLRIKFNSKFLQQLDTKSILVLDAIKRDIHQRIALDKTEDQKVELTAFTESSNPNLRLSVVSTEDKSSGLILFSTKTIGQSTKKRKPKESETLDQDQQKDILKIKWVASIGDRLWLIDWSVDNDVTIWVNKRWEDAYSGTKKPILQAFLLPDIVRVIFTQTFVKFNCYDDIKEGNILDWFRWAEQMLPEEKAPIDKTFSENGNEWLEWLENLLGEFCDREHENKKSFLSSMEEVLYD